MSCEKRPAKGRRLLLHYEDLAEVIEKLSALQSAEEQENGCLALCSLFDKNAAAAQHGSMRGLKTAANLLGSCLTGDVEPRVRIAAATALTKLISAGGVAAGTESPQCAADDTITKVSAASVAEWAVKSLSESIGAARICDLGEENGSPQENCTNKQDCNNSTSNNKMIANSAAAKAAIDLLAALCESFSACLPITSPVANSDGRCRPGEATEHALVTAWHLAANSCADVKCFQHDYEVRCSAANLLEIVTDDDQTSLLDALKSDRSECGAMLEESLKDLVNVCSRSCTELRSRLTVLYHNICGDIALQSDGWLSATVGMDLPDAVASTLGNLRKLEDVDSTDTSNANQIAAASASPDGGLVPGERFCDSSTVAAARLKTEAYDEWNLNATVTRHRLRMLNNVLLSFELNGDDCEISSAANEREGSFVRAVPPGLSTALTRTNLLVNLAKSASCALEAEECRLTAGLLDVHMRDSYRLLLDVVAAAFETAAQMCRCLSTIGAASSSAVEEICATLRKTAAGSEGRDLTTTAAEGRALTTTAAAAEGRDLTTTAAEGRALTTTAAAAEGTDLTTTAAAAEGRDLTTTAAAAEGRDLTTTAAAAEGRDLTRIGKSELEVESLSDPIVAGGSAKAGGSASKIRQQLLSLQPSLFSSLTGIVSYWASRFPDEAQRRSAKPRVPELDATCKGVLHFYVNLVSRLEISRDSTAAAEFLRSVVQNCVFEMNCGVGEEEGLHLMEILAMITDLVAAMEGCASDSLLTYFVEVMKFTSSRSDDSALTLALSAFNGMTDCFKEDECAESLRRQRDEILCVLIPLRQTIEQSLASGGDESDEELQASLHDVKAFAEYLTDL